ncbi:hypothetical protein [Paenibacillus donghaensis]|uniref:Chromosome segregation ATPase n=1 Tax=Paenibacillus donghaensis TaxID=414771 RepID=A0A2Z2K5L5_9BACL|nr:hypothetical protein [Paenibacillus donghaensis]ASA21426.1 hypothetical protein B9T62_11935 [Paenibacillus donghaensis]
MPRIERIRIAGLKYEKMLKKYDDMLLDLCNEEGPANTLITLMNGGGKGVLLQAIFQLLMPKAAWGKDNENQVEAFFHNHKKQLKPYTFHVAIEWLLDHSERNEYITTGIALTAHQSLDQQEIKVDYMLYTLLNYGEGAELTIASLPLYDQAAGEPASFEALQQFLRERRGEVIVYGSSGSELRKYYDFLAVRDIHIGEWRNMRRINGEEGGIKGYFKKHEAFSNHNLFEKLIIPEIGASLGDGLREEDQSLQQMFMDVAVIAQRLPMLEQREQAYAEFIGMASPLQGLVEQGAAADSSVQASELHGRQIYSAIQAELKNTETGRSEAAEELSGQYAEGKQLRFEWDNLKYLGSRQEHDLKAEELKGLGDHQGRARQRLEDSRQSEKQLEVDFYLAKRLNYTRQMEQWQKEIAAIEGSLETQERQQVINSVKAELRSQWDIVFKLWQQTLAGFGASQQKLRDEERGLRKSREELLLELGGIQTEIPKLTAAIRQFSEDTGAFAALHGQEAAHAPDPALQRTLNEIKSTKEELSRLEEDRKQTEGGKLSLHTSHTRLTEQLAALEREADDLTALLETRTAAESQLWSQLVVLLELYEEHHRLGASALFELKDAIEARFIQRLEQAEQQNKRCRRDYYNQLLDVELQHEPYWLPNGDILTVKDKLDALKIHSIAGSSYLNDLPLGQRREELERQPLLPYGLIVTRREAAKIQPGLLAELLLKSAVPVFVREEMISAGQAAYTLLEHQGLQMVIQPEQFLKWRDGIQAQLKEQEQTLKDAEAYHSRLRTAQLAYAQLFQTEHSHSLTAKRKLLEERHRELLKALEQLNTQLQGNETALFAIQRAITDGGVRRTELEQRETALRGWTERLRKQASDYKDKQKLVEHKAQLEKDSLVKEQQLAHLKTQLDSMGSEREQWMGEARFTLFPKLQSWFPEIVFPVEDTSALQEAETVNPAEQDVLLQLLSRVEGLQQSLTRNELEIRTRQAGIRTATQQVTELEVSLTQVDRDWAQQKLPEGSPESIQAARTRQKADTLMLDEDYQQLHDAYIRCETEVDHLLKNLRKLEKSIQDTHERAAELWLAPLEEKQEELRERTAENEQRIQRCKQTLERIDLLLQILNNQRTIMNAQMEVPVLLKELPEELLLSVRESCQALVADWLQALKESRAARAELSRKVKEEKHELSGKLSKSGWNRELETKIQERLNSVHWDDFEVARQVLDSMLRSSQDQMESIRSDKEGMELSRSMWVGRASKRVVQILDILKRMERRMIIHNENQHAFPLVRLNYKNIQVPRSTDEIEPQVTDFFNRTIHELLDKYPKMEQVPAPALKEIINDGRLLYAALQNRFPVLQVYKPVTENYFLYAAPEDYHYSDWEVINRGAMDEAVGSGGQRQSVQLLVAMMIMTHKRVNRENKGWTVFLYDNPFGEMVSNNVLDPVFEISKALKFQWLIVTPPELVKNDVSLRFGVYWQLYFSGTKGDMLESTLVKGGRKLTPLSLF